MKKLVMILGLIIMTAAIAQAQEPPAFDNNDPTNGSPIPAGIPVDGGVSLLAVAGAGVALKKLRKKQAA